MPKVNNRWLIETARYFGMSVRDFADTLGYSRQTLYQAASGQIRLNGKRFNVALHKLGVISRSRYESEVKLAEDNYKFRTKMINELQKRLVEQEEENETDSCV